MQEIRGPCLAFPAKKHRLNFYVVLFPRIFLEKPDIQPGENTRPPLKSVLEVYIKRTSRVYRDVYGRKEPPQKF